MTIVNNDILNCKNQNCDCLYPIYKIVSQRDKDRESLY